MTDDSNHTQGATPMTQHSQNGEGVEARAFGLSCAKKLFDGRKGHGGGPCSRRIFTQAEVAALCEVAFTHGARQSLAREPATADVGREQIARIVCDIVVQITCEENATDASIQAQVDQSWHHWTDTADRILALSRAAPSSEPAIAEGERLARKAADLATANLDRDERRWQPTRAHYEGMRNELRAIERILATTPPTTNDAIPADAISKADALAVVRRCTPAAAGGPFSHTNSMRCIADDIARGIAALSAAPSAPATKAGSCFLCAGKCRGHNPTRPAEWVPERGSQAAKDDCILCEGQGFGDAMCPVCNKPATPTDQVKDGKGGGA